MSYSNLEIPVKEKNYQTCFNDRFFAKDLPNFQLLDA